MKNMKFWRTALVATLVLTVMLSVTGGTIAWFTDTVTSSENVIQSGTLDLDVFYSDDDGTSWKELDEKAPALFNHDKWEPGFVQTKAVKLVNAGNLALKYELMFQPTADTNARLEDVIDVYMSKEAAFTRESIKATKPVATLAQLMHSEDEDGAVHGEMLPSGDNGGEVLYIALKMQESAGNDYQNLSVGNGFGLKIEATQLNSESDSFGPDYDKDANFHSDFWDGTADASWYDEQEDEFVIMTAEQLAGLRTLVNDNNVTFEGKTIELGVDIDLQGLEWEPIGLKGKGTAHFKGTLDGNGHAIKNMHASSYFGRADNYTGVALFGSVDDGCVVKNLIITDSQIWTIGYYGAAVVASIEGGEVSFENVSVENTRICAGKHVGGLVGITGRTGATLATVTFENCSMKNIEMLWVNANDTTTNVIGSVGQANANIVGLETATEENVTVTQDRDRFYNYQLGE